MGTAAAAKIIRQQSARHLQKISAVNRRAPPSRHAVLCVFPIRDEITRLPDFLRHYRRLGVERFVAVDNGSSDGSREFLGGEPDVDLFVTDMSYKESRFGATWITGLVHDYGVDRWVISVDVDEHLVFDGVEERSIHDLAALLEREGRRSLPAIMVDMYGAETVGETVVDPNSRLIDTAPFFDGTGYEMTNSPSQRGSGERHIYYVGGPRRRVFRKGKSPFHSELAKTPLVKWDRDTLQYMSHAVYPMALNFGAPRGALLHYKLLSDFEARTEMAVESGRFYQSSAESKAYRSVQEPSQLRFRYSESVRYMSSQSLVDADLMTSISWR